MNQQQLQIARAALWHQTAAAALDTADAASAWLDDLGLCLFLPRHIQLPAPAPSFVEACLGAASVTPPAAALARAAELAARLIDDRRLIPLNLLGAYSDQPDFLVTPDVLPWVAALRGDRQWKTAPGGRTSPLVLRVWQVLDQQGEATALELRERLGRELTEAAVLRALIELWTSLRAVPLPTPGQPTRWTLLSHRFPAQLATAANTAQATALSAVLSVYLRSAVAASAEEAEVFLSPLTARSRIREVIHGMMAARQFATMSVGPQSLLFVEGTLPETAAPDAAAPSEPAVAPSETAALAAPVPAPRPADRTRPFRDGRRPSGPPRFAKPQRADRPYRRDESRRDNPPFDKARPGQPRFEKPRFDKARFDKTRPGQPRPNAPHFSQPRPAPSDHAPRPAASSPSRPGAKPWQRRGPSSFRARPDSAASRPPRPWQKRRPDSRDDRRPDARRPDARRPDAGPRDARPRNPGETKPASSEKRRPANPAESRPPRPWQKRRESPQGTGQRPPSQDTRPSRDQRASSSSKSRRPTNDRPPRGERPSRDKGRRSSFTPSATQPRTGGPTSGRNFKNKPGFSRSGPKKSFKKPFRPSNSFPAKPNPRKNRNQEETPE